MFTGIVEEIGIIRRVVGNAKSAEMEIDAGNIMEDTKIGDSIAVNGVCLTVHKKNGNSFKADVMHETMSRSNLKDLVQGSHVNIERAMRVDGRFGGHMVTGHVDDTGIIVQMKRDENAVWFTIKTSEKVMKYMVEKGAVTIDGISLTVAKTDMGQFQVSTIPHTLSVTTLGEKKVGDIVNLEADILGKYIERFMGNREEKSKGITMEFLAHNGF